MVFDVFCLLRHELQARASEGEEVVIEDKTTMEQMRLVAELDEKDKSIIFGMIETMLTKKKFKDFFNKNAAML